ncbi:Arsenate reductase thioredoxin-coupled, LMWP family [hydrothermal vent metagenome]|uniref:Arsenate reductase thioredoxin-coupled, LMWP family n=1 Tax=hydrothermal vent metagenome TaxID=652676 RepID=A0A3B1BQW4_9ZZZZ
MSNINKKFKVLILCTGNSARSQMAEGFLNQLGHGLFEAYSAGVEPKGVNPLAITAMREVGIDISHHKSENMEVYLNDKFDFVITVCDNANEKCPIFPGENKRIHWSFDDPAGEGGDESKRLAMFRRVRDEIKTRIGAWVASANKGETL